MSPQSIYNILAPYWPIFLAILLTSIAYAIVLQQWSKHYPESFDDNTWLTVVIGDGYVVLWLAVIIPVDAWLKLGAALLVACIPIIYRSLINAARRRRKTNHKAEHIYDQNPS